MSDETIRKLLAIADKIEYAGCTSVQKTYEQEFADVFNAEIQALKDKHEALIERLKQEAMGHAQEARTMQSIVFDIYKYFGIQKGNWNGSTPVIDKHQEALRKQRNSYIKIIVKIRDDYTGDFAAHPFCCDKIIKAILSASIEDKT